MDTAPSQPPPTYDVPRSNPVSTHLKRKATSSPSQPPRNIGKLCCGLDTNLSLRIISIITGGMGLIFFGAANSKSDKVTGGDLGIGFLSFMGLSAVSTSNSLQHITLVGAYLS